MENKTTEKNVTVNGKKYTVVTVSDGIQKSVWVHNFGDTDGNALGSISTNKWYPEVHARVIETNERTFETTGKFLDSKAVIINRLVRWIIAKSA